MKVLQALHSYKPYIPHFEEKYNIDKANISFNELKSLLLKDRFYASHLLNPVLNDDENGFYTMWDSPLLQHKWAEEKGWKEKDVKKILFAQIEDFKPDVFYNCSPIRFEADEVKSQINPNIIKICWFASPETKHIDFSVYKSRLTNVPLDIKTIKEVGFRNDLFQPAHDPVMDDYAKNEHRDTDIFFYGQYHSSFFKKRNELIDSLIDFKLKSNYRIDLALQYSLKKKYFYPFSRPTRFKKLFGGKIVNPSADVRNNSIVPLYGLDLYKKIASSKVVFNAAVDFSGKYKVNMRNFETMGLGAHLLSDEGVYPESFKVGENLTTYSDFNDFKKKAKYLVENASERMAVANAGYEMIKKKYSKQKQWQRFQEIVAS
ncbi:MAG: glycosyltransferase [Bacteroidetes bacterium]|nr:glycosyltransferase [Bacteroidota bacterium]